MASIPVHRLQIARKPAAAANCYRRSVTHVAYLGPFVQISVRVEWPDARDAPALRPPKSKRCAIGDRVHAAWDRGDVILIPIGKA